MSLFTIKKNHENIKKKNNIANYRYNISLHNIVTNISEKLNSQNLFIGRNTLVFPTW